MKTQFSRRRNSIIGPSFVGPVSLTLLALVLLFALVRVFAPGVVVALGTPLWQGGTMLSAGVGNVGSFFTSSAKLANDRDRLLRENAALTVENATLAARTSDLTRVLGTRTEPGPGILASVLARPPISPYDVLVVDQGTESGVQVGMRALGAGGVPLGTVESASGSSARVMLYSSSGRETESWVGEQRLPVALRGEGSGAFSATVARESGVVVGDMIYVTGAGALPIGTVTKVESDPSSPRSHIDIKPLLNPFSTVWVTLAP